MRWPLRLQIMLPMAAIMLLTVLVVGGSGAYLAAQATRARIEAQVAGVAQLVEESNFPLTDAVLRQMKALSGAAMVLVDDRDRALATSGSTRQFEPHLSAANISIDRSILLADLVQAGGRDYFHTALKLNQRRGARQAGTLHIFYPESDYRRAWMSSVYPSLGFIAVAMPAVMLLAAATGAGISRRMKRLQGQVDRIAEGDFQQMELADRDDEIRALGLSVNRMASMLTSYEDQVRHAERMRTLAVLGGGVAHQLRNSATGCGMALELHADECTSGRSCESLEVARQQLRLMEEYIQRFLQLGKPTEALRTEIVHLGELVDELLPLVNPAARHRGVDLVWDGAPQFRAQVLGDANALSQLVINLLLNAIEAAAGCGAKTHRPGRVVVALVEQSGERIQLTISDSGNGPAAEVRDHLFQPFVSEKPEGIGLGLSVASDVAARHGGRVTWHRANGLTTFVVEFPLALTEVQCA